MEIGKIVWDAKHEEARFEFNYKLTGSRGIDVASDLLHEAQKLVDKVSRRIEQQSVSEPEVPEEELEVPKPTAEEEEEEFRNFVKRKPGRPPKKLQKSDEEVPEEAFL